MIGRICHNDGGKTVKVGDTVSWGGLACEVVRLSYDGRNGARVWTDRSVFSASEVNCHHTVSKASRLPNKQDV